MDSEQLDELADIILKRGMDTDTEDGFEFKLHKIYPDAPRSPVKFNLARKNVRRGGRLEEEDITRIGRALYDYSRHKRLVFPAMAGIPNVGQAIAENLQRQVRHQEGQPIILVPLIKVGWGDRSEIGRIPLTPELRKKLPPGQTVLPVDDVLTHATIGQSAVHRLRQTGYVVREFLTLLDYKFDGAEILHGLGVEAYSLFSVESLIKHGKERNLVPMSTVDAFRRFSEDMRLFLQKHSVPA